MGKLNKKWLSFRVISFRGPDVKLHEDNRIGIKREADKEFRLKTLVPVVSLLFLSGLLLSTSHQ